MRYLIDTNVISELRKGRRADPAVQRWIAAVEGKELALSVLVLGEIRLGVVRRSRRDPRSAPHLDAWFARVERAYRGRTLPVDEEVAEVWAHLNEGRTLPVVDGLQAATAVVHGLTFVTRNTKDLQGVQVPLLNPFV